MKYQVRANLFFDEEDEANDFYHDCALALAKSVTLNPGQDHSEISQIELIHNRHEENPNEPCSLINTATTEP